MDGGRRGEAAASNECAVCKGGCGPVNEEIKWACALLEFDPSEVLARVVAMPARPSLSGRPVGSIRAV